eukprot:12880484-Prorocentrum_lima.AAC.1
MEALGKHCYCPGDIEVKRGGALGMHHEGFRVLEAFAPDDDATTPHTLLSRVYSTYPQEIIVKKFKTVEQ